MKRRFIVSVSAMLLLCPFIGISQCGTSLNTISYDTLVNGGGFNTFNFSFPRFDGSLGTLAEVRFSSVINMEYAFTLENQNTSPATDYEAFIGRRDRIFLGATQLSNTFMPQVPFGPFNLEATDHIEGSGPDFVSIPPTTIADDYIIQRTHSNVADFFGTGNLNLQYVTTSLNTYSGPTNVDFKNTASDNIHFTMTYVYCANLILSKDIINFSAKKKDDIVRFEWNVDNEVSGRTYEVERSYDGKKYTPLSALKASLATITSNRYELNYKINPRDIGQGIFRLKQTDADGAVFYSTIRTVELSGKTSAAITLFPNPASGETQLVLNNTKNSNWQVDIIGSTGKLVQRSFHSRTMVARINSNGQLPKGIYYVKALNLETKEVITQKLIIQ